MIFYYHGIDAPYPEDFTIVKLDNNNSFSDPKLINAYNSNLGQLTDVFLGEINGNSRLIEAYSNYGFSNIVIRDPVSLEEITVFKQTQPQDITQRYKSINS